MWFPLYWNIDLRYDKNVKYTVRFGFGAKSRSKSILWISKAKCVVGKDSTVGKAVI